MRRLGRDLVCLALGAVLALALTGRVAAEGAVPADRLVAVLVAEPYDWRPDAARKVVAWAPARVVAPLPPYLAYYCSQFDRCPEPGPWVGLYTAHEPPATVEHEYHHAADDEATQQVGLLADFDRLARRGDELGVLARRIRSEHDRDVYHLNHALIEALGWDYARLGDRDPAYRARWFWYGRDRRRAFLPEVRR